MAVCKLDVNADFLLSDLLAVSAKLKASKLYDGMGAVSNREKERVLKVAQVLVGMAGEK